jgi:hypothetical protein
LQEPAARCRSNTVRNAIQRGRIFLIANIRDVMRGVELESAEEFIRIAPRKTNIARLPRRRKTLIARMSA